MPRPKESLYPEDWFNKAEKDFERTRARLNEGDLEDAAFHLQQAIEKYLKAYLLSRGWKLKKIHDLEFLLDEATKYYQKLEDFRPLCQEVTGYYLLERYPFLREEPSYKEIEDNLNRTLELIKLVKEERK